MEFVLMKERQEAERKRIEAQGIAGADCIRVSLVWTLGLHAAT